jgi:hypothetical protein
MNDQTVQDGDRANSVRKVVSVKAPQDVAWRTFTEKMGTWWPLATHKIGNTKAVDAVIEPRVGGRWYERGNRPRGWCSCGRSAPTGGPTRI